MIQVAFVTMWFRQTIPTSQKLYAMNFKSHTDLISNLQAAHVVLENHIFQNRVVHQHQNTYQYSARTSRGRKFPTGKELYIAKKEFAYIECAQGDRPARCPNHFFACAPLLLFHGGDGTCSDVMKLLAGPDEVMWLVVR